MSPRGTPWAAYKVIASGLRGRIRSGEFTVGSALPSEAVLSREYAVARNTMRRALDQLAAEGVVVVSPGRRRIVAAPGSAAIRPAPQYRTIAVELRRMIEQGELQPGDRVPSESTLAARYAVARSTARHALAELEGAALIESAHGKGRFVRPR